ncbi:MAG: hypothetical protein K6F09_07170 [Clostridiales bacterium]|nr:hypothetical protein [Clostridiales bacterium]
MNESIIEKKIDGMKHPFRIIYFIIAIVLFIGCIIAAISNFLSLERAKNWAKNVFVPNGEVMNGTLDIDGIEQITDVPKGEVKFFINKRVIFENSYARGNIIIQNPEKCEYILEFRFYLLDSGKGEPIFTSDKIAPGQYLSGDKLNTYLKKGSYKCSYVARAYSIETPDKPAGETSGFLDIIIEN